MAEMKTVPTGESVEAFLDRVPDEKKRRACFTVLDIMKKASRVEPKMWGDSIVGFGEYHYHYASGRQGDWFLIGFSPRKQDLTLYINSGFDRHEQTLQKLGKFKVGKACLYIKKLGDIDLAVLQELVDQSVKYQTGGLG